MGYEWLGVAGLACILAGWVPETLETIRNRRCGLNIGFALLYFLGSALLAAYSFILQDIVFMALNTAATAMALLNLYFCHFGKAEKAKGKKR